MGAEAQSVPAATKLFNQANEILGYLETSDSIDFCLSPTLGVLVYSPRMLSSSPFKENNCSAYANTFVPTG